jgi:hypothetical protein
MRPILFLLFVFFLIGCGSAPGRQEGSPPGSKMVQELEIANKAYAPGASAPAEMEGSEPKKEQLGTKIIYTSEIDLETEDASATKSKIETAVKTAAGYITDSKISGKKNSERTASITARIPTKMFESFVQDVSNFGEPISISRSSEDVTMEYYDVEARIKSKKIQEQRLQELLKASTGKLSEILAVEKELLRIREDIESVEGRMRYLNNKVDFSTVVFSIREVKYSTPEGNPGFATNAKRAFNNSLARLGMRVNSFAIWCVAVSPYLFILAGILVFVWIVSSRRKKKFQAEISKL